MGSCSGHHLWPDLPTLPPPGDPSFQRSWRRARRAPAPEWQAPSGEGQMRSSLPRSCSSEGWGPGRERRTPQREETTPGHSFEQTKPGTSGASGRGSRDIAKWQGARAGGCQGHYKFTHSARSPAQTRADNKRSSPPSQRLRGTRSPTPTPKPGDGRRQHSATHPLPAPEGRAPFLALAPGQSAASENPTLLGQLCSLLAPK